MKIYNHHIVYDNVFLLQFPFQKSLLMRVAAVSSKLVIMLGKTTLQRLMFRNERSMPLVFWSHATKPGSQKMLVEAAKAFCPLQRVAINDFSLLLPLSIRDASLQCS